MIGNDADSGAALRGPIEDRLANIGLESPAADLEDFLGDKRGKGVPGGYDDAIAHRGDKH